MLNSRPLTFVSTEDYAEPLTPFHLLTGYQLINLPDFSNSEEDPDYIGTTDPVTLTRQMKHLNTILNRFWKHEYILELRETHRFASRAGTASRPVDIVMVFDEEHPRAFWKMGRIESLKSGDDGLVRGACVRVRSGNTSTILNRLIQHLFPLEVTGATDKDVLTLDPQESMLWSEVTGTTEKDVLSQPDLQEPDPKSSRPERAAARIAKQTIKDWMILLEYDIIT